MRMELMDQMVASALMRGGIDREQALKVDDLSHDELD